MLKNKNHGYSHHSPEVLLFEIGGQNRMVDSFIVHFVEVFWGTERKRIQFPFGAFINESLLFPPEGNTVRARLTEVLVNLRPDRVLSKNSIGSRILF